MKIFQKGFNYSQDGPGNRLVLHLQGCNMRCPWCANPEGLDAKGVLMTDEKWLEPSFCPHGAVREHTLDREVCKNCTGMECIRLHRGKGIKYSCQDIETGALIEEILAAQMMYYDGGGVTFTGGECTVQFDELQTVLKELKAQEINTAIESNGAHVKLPELFPYIDHLILDCKLINEEKHKEVMGISNRIILENIRKAAEKHPSVHVRVPLIGGINNGEEEIKELLTFFQSLPQEHIAFEVLKYHEYGKQKWAECGLAYAMDEKAKVTSEEVNVFKERIKKAGLRYKGT